MWLINKLFSKRITDIKPISSLYFNEIPQGYYDIYGYVELISDKTKRKYIETSRMKDILLKSKHEDFIWNKRTFSE